MTDPPERFTVWHGLLLAEGAVLMISLITPIMPSKTGSGRGIPHLFLEDPRYAEQVFVYFVVTNLLLVFLGVVLTVWVKFSKK